MEGVFMGFAPVFEKERRKEPRFSGESDDPETDSIDWVRVAACGSLIVGGVMLLSGQRRAGLVVAASGTALALLDQEETLKRWWQALPEYVERAQQMIDQVQEVVDDVTEKGESLRRALGR
jgi:hypothetical protein